MLQHGSGMAAGRVSCSNQPSGLRSLFWAPCCRAWRSAKAAEATAAVMVEAMAAVIMAAAITEAAGTRYPARFRGAVFTGVAPFRVMAAQTSARSGTRRLAGEAF